MRRNEAKLGWLSALTITCLKQANSSISKNSSRMQLQISFCFDHFTGPKHFPMPQVWASSFRLDLLVAFKTYQTRHYWFKFI